MVTDVYLSTAAAVGRLLRRPELARSWDAPSALAEFRVRGLAGHLARAVFTTEVYLAAEVPPDAPRPGRRPVRQSWRTSRPGRHR